MKITLSKNGNTIVSSYVIKDKFFGYYKIKTDVELIGYTKVLDEIGGKEDRIEFAFDINKLKFIDVAYGLNINEKCIFSTKEATKQILINEMEMVAKKYDLKIHMSFLKEESDEDISKS